MINHQNSLTSTFRIFYGEKEKMDNLYCECIAGNIMQITSVQSGLVLFVSGEVRLRRIII